MSLENINKCTSKHNNFVKNSNQIVTKLSYIRNELELGNVNSGLTKVRHLIHEITKPLSLAEIPTHNTTRLRIYTLGRFTVELDGHAIVFKRKAQKRPLDLLKTMISLGSRAIAKSQLTELLWPDSSGDASVSVMNTNLSRLRKLIGKDAIQTNNGTISLNPNYCWVDCWQLEKIINIVKQKTSKSSNCIASVFQIYQGDFMAGDELGWIILRRNNIKNKVFVNLNRYGQWLIHNKQFEEANNFLHQCITLDNTYEDFYLNLMRCQIMQREFIEASQTYRHFKKYLSYSPEHVSSSKCSKLYQSLKLNIANSNKQIKI